MTCPRQVARALVAANGCADKVTVIQGKLEEITLPEQVGLWRQAVRPAAHARAKTSS